ncbi:MarR family transcriptional regulator [Novosphingobium beihaiensis]|uniref:MarR family transcriptional regulator n=1 Tax=Novosphingobium beihaiensis TaxID=2930389 RepID=A0ABT0BLC6_9SPHN|nr:MarR family transcriptional regulator [Novosphingobium beihaiensis]MCJ2185852.1 MarR family transcriptional regulator [Novosphingobium beihaiensis]
MSRKPSSGLQPYPQSLAGSLLAAREAVMAPIRPFLRESNVTEQQWRVLRVLADAETMDAKGIADQALLYAPTVTRILKELGDRKLIERKSDPEDGRRSIISITDEGRDLVVGTASHTKVLLDAYAKAFGPERLEAFKAEALALAEALESLGLEE